MKQWETLESIERIQDKLSGVWVFRDTRVPVSALFENIRDGATINEFLEWFPGVDRLQAESILTLEMAKCAETPLVRSLLRLNRRFNLLYLVRNKLNATKCRNSCIKVLN